MIQLFKSFLKTWYSFLGFYRILKDSVIHLFNDTVSFYFTRFLKRFNDTVVLDSTGFLKTQWNIFSKGFLKRPNDKVSLTGFLKRPRQQYSFSMEFQKPKWHSSSKRFESFHKNFDYTKLYSFSKLFFERINE